MLKRHRPVSPPPPGPSIPLVSDTPPDSHRRESKRRRILPPSLDGQARSSSFGIDEDDGEEEDDDEMDGRTPSSARASGSNVHNAEYESANTFLHDLHALHRHRLIFASPSPPFQPEISSPLRFQHKPYLPSSMPDYPRVPDKQDASGIQDFGRGLPFEEVQSVKERYEDTNRLLGSLFLTRRKQLDPGPQPYNT